jgi:hypothetical protein
MKVNYFFGKKKKKNIYDFWMRPQAIACNADILHLQNNEVNR